MNTSFRLIALPYERFATLFDQSDAELERIGARRMIVDEKPGYPCRVSLADAEVGETVTAMLVSAEVVEGGDLEESIGRQFEDDAVSYLHIHNARPGCYNCRVERESFAPRLERSTIG